MGEEKIRSDEEQNVEKDPLSAEELEEVAGGVAFHEAGNKFNLEEKQK